MTDDGKGTEATSAETDTPAGRSRQGRSGQEVTELDAHVAAGASTTASASDKEERRLKLHNFEFDLERECLYNVMRRDFLDRMHRVMGFVVVIGGTSALGTIVGDIDAAASWLALCTVTAGALDLVFGFSTAARRHETAYVALARVLGEVRATGDHDRYADWQIQFHEVVSGAPPYYRAVDAWAHNLICESHGAAREHYLDIPDWHLWLKNFWSFTSARYDPMKPVA